jgi:hypothetical protein
MRAFVLVPITLAIAVAIGLAMIVGTGHNPHVKEMLTAAMTCLVAGELAVVPLLLMRGANQIGIAQAALVGTVMHLFACVAVAAVVILGRLPLGISFVYWLLALYWVTLMALVVAFAKAIRSAPVAGAPR